MNILTFHPEELARQLTLVEFKLYGKIKPKECLNQNWMHKTQRNELAPNILRMIGRFNEVSTWVASEIVKTVDLTQRVKVLKHVIEIAEVSFYFYFYFYFLYYLVFNIIFIIICFMGTHKKE